MPKSKTLRVSGPARRDLAGIGAHTRRQWGAAQKRKYLGLIKDHLRHLRDLPGLGRRRDDIEHGLRSLTVGSHIVFYQEKRDMIEVLRVLHESMDPTRHLE